MPRGVKVGHGYVTVEPDFSGFQEELERALRRRLGAAGDKGGRDFSAGMTRRLRSQMAGVDVENMFAPLIKRIDAEALRAKRRFWNGVSGSDPLPDDVFGIRAATKQLEGDTFRFQRSAQKAIQANKGLQKDMFGIGSAAKEAGITLDRYPTAASERMARSMAQGRQEIVDLSKEIERRIPRLSEVARKTAREMPDAFGINDAAIRAKAAATSIALDQDRMARQAGRLRKAAQDAGHEVVDVLEEIRRRTPLASGGLEGLQKDMFGIGRAMRDAGRNARGVESATAQLRRFREETRHTGRLARLLGTRYAGVAAGANALRGAFGRATASGRGFQRFMERSNRTAMFFRNTLRLLKFPALITGIGLLTQGLAALAAGFVAAGSSLGSLAGGLVTLPALAGAAAQAFGALKLATAGIGDTIKAALDAQVKGGGQAVDTLRQQRDATDRVADAERQAKTARGALNAAIAEAAREYQDLEAAAARSYLAEEDGVLRVEELRKELNRVVNDSASTELDIRFAENALAQGKLDLKELRTEAKRTRADYRAAAAAGVQGMPQVVAARQAVADAERDVTRATEDSTNAMGAQGAAADALAEKMGQLPTSAQAFVREIIGLKPKLDELRAASADGLFPGVTAGLRAVMGNFGVVKTLVGDTSTAFGGLAKSAGEALGGKAWGRDLKLIGDQNVKTINQMGRAGGNLADTFRHILVAARPFVNWIGKGTVALTGWMKQSAKTGRENGKLAAYFDRVKETMQLVGPILKGVGGSLLNIGKAARPLGNEILGALGKSAEGFRKWTGSVEGQNSLKKYFSDAKPAIFEMGRLIRDVTKAFFELGNQPGAAPLIKQVRTELLPAFTDVVRTLTGAFGKALVGALTSGVKLLQSLAHESGPLVVLAKALGSLADGLRWVIDEVPGVKQLVVGLLALKALSFAASITGIAKLGRTLVATTVAFKSLAAGQALSTVMAKRGIAATVAAKVAAFAAAGATKAWAFATRLLTLAWRATPIGMVITGLTLLGGALVLAWKKSDTFKRIVTGAFNAIVDAGKWMADKYLGYITTILGGFSSLISAGSKLPFIGGKFKGLAGVIDDARDKIDGFRESLRDTDGLDKQGKAVEALKEKIRTSMRDGTIATREGMREILRLTRKNTGESKDAVATNFEAATKTIRRAMRDGVLAAQAGTRLLRKLMAEELKVYGVDPGKALKISKLGGSRNDSFMLAGRGYGGPGDIGRQQGGPVPLQKGAMVPGQGSGDKVPLHVGGRLAAMVEPGEFVSVANRNATAALMGVNKAVPRFQGGGIVELLHPFNDPAGHGGGNSHLHVAMNSVKAIVALGKRLQKMGWLVGEHPAFGGVGGMHAPGGYHYTSQAIDVNWPDAGAEGAKIKALLPMLGGVVSGAVGALAPKLPRLVVEGMDSPLKSLVQGAINKTRGAAQRHLNDQLGAFDVSGAVMSGDGDVEATFAKVAKRLSKSKIATLALGMAGYAESGMEDLDYGHSSSKGSLQLLASTAAGLGVSPHDEAAVSSLFLTRGFYGRGGANALAAQGLPAHLVAQNVQGSAFSDGSNYLAQEGPARAWMKRFGLKKGGIVRMVGDSLGVGTVGMGGLAGRLKQKLVADVLGGRPALGSAGLFRGAAKQLIFDLGTNDTSAGAPANVLRAVDRATGGTPIHALTLNGPLAAAKNKALRGVKGDVNLIDWAGKSAGLLGPDGYHATGAGYGERATLIAKHVNAKAAAMKRATQEKAQKGKSKPGGIGAPLGKVGLGEANIPEAIRKTLKRVRHPEKKKGVRKKQIARLMARINEQFSLPPDLVKRLAGYETNIPIWADRGDRADSLTVELEDADGEPLLDADGRQVVDLGRMEGKTAGQWKQQELGGLLGWRNDLIEARVRVRELIEQVKARIVDQQNKLVELRKRIKAQMDVRGKLGDLVAAKRKPNKMKAKIKSLAGQIAPVLRRKKLFGRAFEGLLPKTLVADSIKDVQTRMATVSAHRAANVRERNTITGKILPALTGRRDALLDDQGTYEDGLTDVAGPGGGRERADKFFGQVPDFFGQFSGQIFDAHQRLKELNTPGPIIKRTPDEPDHSGNLDSAIFQQHYGIDALKQLQENITAGMQRLVPFGGVFHQGGVVPGPVGQERMILAQSGERVLSLDEMAQLQPRGGDGGGDIVLEATIPIYVAGEHLVDERVEIKLNERARRQFTNQRMGMRS